MPAPPRGSACRSSSSSSGTDRPLVASRDGRAPMMVGAELHWQPRIIGGLRLVRCQAVRRTQPYRPRPLRLGGVPLRVRLGHPAPSSQTGGTAEAEAEDRYSMPASRYIEYPPLATWPITTTSIRVVRVRAEADLERQLHTGDLCRVEVDRPLLYTPRACADAAPNRRRTGCPTLLGRRRPSTPPSPCCRCSPLRLLRTACGRSSRARGRWSGCLCRNPGTGIRRSSRCSDRGRSRSCSSTG
jgi:hypothetical protein